MKYKQLIQKKIFELNNFLNGQDALISTGRSIDELRAHIERMKAKLLEIETLINSENEG
jgi:DNA polymerase II small subunit/DNA polymerase delta subunit B